MIRNRTCLHLDENNCDGHSIEAKYCLQLPCPLSQGNRIFNNSCNGINLTLNLYITPFALCCTSQIDHRLTHFSEKILLFS